MFWKSSKDKPKESTSTELVRQDPRTSVKTTTAQTETTNTTVQNATIFNNNTRTITYQTQRQTVTHQQQATVTEIVTRRTPTSEELEQMLQSFNLSKSEANARRRSGNFSTKPANNNAYNGIGISTKSMAKFKTTTSPVTRSTFTYDSPTISGSNGTGSSNIGAGMRYKTTPNTPTLVKTEETTVTAKNGRTVTTRVEQQRIKLDNIKLSSPNSPLTLPAIQYKSNNNSSNSLFNTSSIRPSNTASTISSLSSYNNGKSSMPLTLKSDAKLFSTPTKASTTNSSAYKSLSNTYTSPYTNRTTTTTPVTTRSYTATKPVATYASTKTTTNNVKPQSIFEREFKSSTAVPTTKTIYAPSSNANSATFNIPSYSTAKPYTTSTPAASSLTTSTTTALARKKSKLKPGYAYIFNNETFDDPVNEYRSGSSEDVKALCAVLEMFKCNVNVIKNAKLSKIDSTVQSIGKKNFTDYSCLIIVILSHGSRHEAIAAKDGTYSIDDKILFPLLRNNTLKDKPKIFFIQACKGAMEIGGFKTDSAQPHGSPSEILKCYSTFEGYVSYRLDVGSIFIQTLCENLKLSGKDKDIKAIMDDVIRLVKQRTNNQQIPSLTTTLTIPFVFGDYC